MFFFLRAPFRPRFRSNSLLSLLTSTNSAPSSVMAAMSCREGLTNCDRHTRFGPFGDLVALLYHKNTKISLSTALTFSRSLSNHSALIVAPSIEQLITGLFNHRHYYRHRAGSQQSHDRNNNSTNKKGTTEISARRLFSSGIEKIEGDTN